ncbi:MULTISPECIES: rod-binding protein [unclassified Epibacterium]|jgi:Rod binding domain-containing protein|uniref:rod-binding protein n=1 Tax=unclassified Epibacterium TaxID=2639179 RepID=UPI001EF73D9F|nr:MULTISPECIES: rod-binding protein [unclassified Epibacterium]MCG7623629.1 rod-binding protein [Epibacterium sp. Ofav1-8]MCG7628160.1 rod-binding protein [Epibacterium sp. MM17-32]
MPIPSVSLPPAAASLQHAADPKDAALREAAIDLEASFLSEMLKAAGLGKSPEAFGGGAGEDQFSGLLVNEQARAMAEAGGIGLAESIYNSLKDSQE